MNMSQLLARLAGKIVLKHTYKSHLYAFIMLNTVVTCELYFLANIVALLFLSSTVLRFLLE